MKKLEWHFVLAVDKGSPRAAKEDAHGEKKRDGDPYAVNVFAFAPADHAQRVFHVYCFERTGLYARLIAQLLLGADDKAPTGCKPHDKPGGVFGAIGWPDGMVLDGDQALIEELANVYGLRFEKPEKRPDYKAGAIELCNGDLVDGRIKIIEDSPLHRQITGLQWAEQDSGALKEDPSQPNNSTDCLIYARKKIAALFEAGVVARDDDGGSSGGAAAATYDDPMGLDDGGGDPFALLPMDDFDDFEGRF
jgi:hypothetical protein